MVAGDFTNVHAVITQVGVNDQSVSTPIGTISDATTASTFFGQYKKFIEFVLTSNSYLKLILGTPTGNNFTTSSRDAILPYRQAVRDMCDLYCLSCWDVAKISQLSPFTQAAYTADGLHPDYSNERWTDGNPAHQAVARQYGSKIMFGSTLAAHMHNVFPADWTGDPWIGESDNTYNPEQI